jgi:site-specific recombinase XerD
MSVEPRMDGGAPDLGIEEAVNRWLDHLRIDKADQTVADYGYRLDRFVDWCESQGFESLRQLGGWEIDSYANHRRANDLAPITLKNELITLRQFFKYAARLELVPESLPERVELPDVDQDDEVSDTILSEEAATMLLESYRSGALDAYHRPHAFLELAWFTGARLGGLRSLDLDDVVLEGGYVEFHHRPDTDTPLKNGRDGERAVGISDHVVEALSAYIDQHRIDVADDYGRKPLFTTNQGRISANAVRTTSYYGTIPCRVQACPHGNERATCDFVAVNDSSKCPSSRSPHQIRSGSITWQLNRGVPADVVAERVNASVDIIEAHYDKADSVTKFQKRREHHLDKLEDKETDND